MSDLFGDIASSITSIKELLAVTDNVDEIVDKVGSKLKTDESGKQFLRDIIVKIKGCKTLKSSHRRVKRKMPAAGLTADDKTGQILRDMIQQEVERSLSTLKLSPNQASKEKGTNKGVKQGKEEKKPQIKDFGDYYEVTSGERQITITKAKLKEFKELYCGEGKLTMNQVCYKLDIPRRDLYLAKTAFSITHDDVPFLDEEVSGRPTEELVQESLERKKAQFFIKLQQAEIKQLKAEVAEYRKKEYFIKMVGESLKEHFEEFAQNYQRPPIIELPKVENGLMLEVPIFDLHLGKLAWGPETGENYDYKIAEQRFMTVIEDIVSLVKERKFEKIIFPIGQDFFNFDTPDGKTTAGTPQNNDLRWQKLFNKGTEILIRAIELLSQIAPVEAFYVPGNHDFTLSYYATAYVSAWFKDNPNIKVDINPPSRKYIEFGKCLIGFTHTDKERKKIFGNMQVEQAEAWGRTKYREWHGGHLHSEQTREDMGVIVRNLSSVTGTDAWHNLEGYVGAIAKSQCFIWDKEKGLREILMTTIER